MNTSDVRLNEQILEAIKCNQDWDFEEAKAKLEFLDKLVEMVIYDKMVDVESPEEKLKALDILLTMKRDYKSFIIKEKEE